MLGYLSLDILFLEAHSFPRKTVRFSEKIMSADKYPSICSRQMKAIVYIYIYILVHAKLRPLDQDFLVTRGTHKCGSSRCDVCNYLIVRDRFSSLTTGTSYTINRGLDCNSRNVVYLINCKVCGFQYVGSTTTKFRLRFNNHKSRLRAHSRMLAVDKESDDLVYRHFYSLGHHGLSDVRIQLIDKVNDKDDLLAKEGQWVYLLKTGWT